MIPTEIDELMWSVAEGGDTHAIEEFGNRYPNLREELLKRIRTVQALKSAGRSVQPSKIPIFRNPQTQPVNTRPIFLALGVAILATMAFGIWKIAAPHQEVKPEVQTINVEPAQMPPPSMITPNDETRQPRPYSQGKPNVGTPINPPVVPNTDMGDASKKTDIELESAPLHAAITLIAEAGHLKVTIAPGLANPTIKVNLHDMTPVEMLKELGKEYAFDTLLDGDRAIMVIPKKDELDDQMTNETR